MLEAGWTGSGWASEKGGDVCARVSVGLETGGDFSVEFYNSGQPLLGLEIFAEKKRTAFFHGPSYLVGILARSNRRSSIVSLFLY